MNSSAAPIVETEDFTLFPTGAAVVDALNRGVAADEVARRLSRVLRVDYGRALSDVLTFRMALKRDRAA